MRGEGGSYVLVGCVVVVVVIVVVISAGHFVCGCFDEVIDVMFDLELLFLRVSG